MSKTHSISTMTLLQLRLQCCPPWLRALGRHPLPPQMAFVGQHCLVSPLRTSPAFHPRPPARQCPSAMVKSYRSRCSEPCLPTQQLICRHSSPAFLEAVTPPYWLSEPDPHLQSSSIPYLIGHLLTRSSGNELRGSRSKPTRIPQQPKF